MKKYISLLSLTALMVSNNAYTMRKPLTAQERTTVNGLIEREKLLNMDILTFIRQGKNTTSKEKALQATKDAIKKYEARDPQAVAQIRKGFTPAQLPAKTAAKLPAKAGRPSNVPAPYKPAPSGTLQRPAVEEEPSEGQSPVVQINPMYENIPNETFSPPASPPQPAKAPAQEQNILTEAKNQLNPLRFSAQKPATTPLKNPSSPAPKTIAPKLLSTSPEQKPTQPASGPTKATLPPQALFPNATKTSPLYPVLDEPKAQSKWLVDKQLNIQTLDKEKDRIKELPENQQQQAINNSLTELGAEAKRAGLAENAFFNQVGRELTVIKTQETPLPAPKPAIAPAPQNAQSKWIINEKLNPRAKEMMQDRMNKQLDPEAKIEELKKAALQLEEEFKSLQLPLAQSTAIYEDFSKILQELNSSISQPTSEAAPAAPAPKPQPTNQPSQPAQSSIEWQNLKKYINNNIAGLKNSSGYGQATTPWLSGLLAAARIDKPNANKTDLETILRTSTIEIERLIETEKKISFKKPKKEIHAIHVCIMNFLYENLAEPTEISLFNNSQPNMDAILASAKAIGAQDPETAMVQMLNKLSESELTAWNNNKDKIKNMLELKWDE